MKLIRFGEPSLENPGILLANNEMIDVSSFVDDYTEDFFQNDGLNKLSEWFQANQASAPRVGQGTRLGPCVPRPSKIICIGQNYADHAKETGKEPPKEPVLFMKATTALSGPNDPIDIPRNSSKTDWEVELAVVIGKRAKYVDESQATEYIAGYTLMNDVSEREFQNERCGQHVKGKSHDTFAPLGPALLTTDEVQDPQQLDLWLDVNGERQQTGNTSKMIFSVTFLISYISQFMTLLPGDVISTGTPPGVGLGKKPPRFLKAGDVVDLGIEGFGAQRHEVVDA